MISVRYSREDRLWTVGFLEPASHFAPSGRWVAMADFSRQDDAARYINWLNGGNGAPFKED